MPVRIEWSRFRSLLAVAAALTCVATLAIGLAIWWLRAAAINEAYRDSSNLAIVLGDQIANSVHFIDLTISDVKRELEARVRATPGEPDRILQDDSAHRLLTNHISRLPYAVLIGLVDRNGKLVNSTQKWPLSPIDVSDSKHYRYFSRVHDEGLYITNALTDRIRQAKVIFFSKRLDDARGRFLGVISVGVRLTYFRHIYESIDSIPGLSFLLLHRNGRLIVRYPGPKNGMIDKIPAGSPWYRLASQGGGQYLGPGYFDGSPYLISVRPLPNYPLVVDVGINKAAALATWRLQALVIGLGTLLVALCSVLLLVALNKQFKLLTASETTLAQANAKVDAALNNMSQGLVMFDRSACLIVCNQRYIDMFRLSREIVKPGTHIRDVLMERVRTGGFSPNEIVPYMESLLASVEAGNSFARETYLPDGRIVRIVNQPIAGGGWVATHEDITEAKRTEERITYAANHDALTGLPTRKLFRQQLEQALKEARHGERFAVLYLDLDHLKRINDTLGHPTGDKLLVGVAERLRDSLKDVDFVARLSGDEFAIIQTKLERPSEAADLATRMREAIHKSFSLDGHEIMVDISIGIAIAPDDASDLDNLVKAADIALYEAKNSGRGTFCFYAPEMNVRMQARNQLERDLKKALANGEFELHYQPIFDLEANRVRTFEALLRWRHPTRGLISPSEFISVAEETGLIVPLGEWVLQTACVNASNWPDEVGVAVNVSPVQMTDKNLVGVVLGAIETAGIKPDRVILEITETVLLGNTATNLATLNRLHAFGIRLSMDDFGTGYSSLDSLMSFPFSEIKIDRSFIAGLADKKKSRAIVRAALDLARSLKFRVVAEGVESQRQIEQLRRMGCTEIQGYVVSPPLPPTELHNILARNYLNDAGVAAQVA